MTETPPEPTPPYAGDDDVILTLGPFGKRVEATADIDVASFVAMAHAEALDRLAVVYGTRTLPTFTGDAKEAVRWAEAQLAAADILDVLRASLDTVSDVPERLRRTAWAKLDGGLPGFTPGDPDPGPDVWPEDVGVPRVSSYAPVSNFPDPYLDPTRAGDVVAWPRGYPFTWEA